MAPAALQTLFTVWMIGTRESAIVVLAASSGASLKPKKATSVTGDLKAASASDVQRVCTKVRASR